MPISSTIDSTFAELDRQKTLIAACTSLFQDLSNHFSTLDKKIDQKLASIRSNRRSLDLQTQSKLASLARREESIEISVDLAVSRIQTLAPIPPSNNPSNLSSHLQSLCSTMNSLSFFDLIVSNRKNTDSLRKLIPDALKSAIDPAKLVMDAISMKERSGDLGWVCVLMLEGLEEVLEDLVVGEERKMVTRVVKERAREMAEKWRKEVERVRACDVHAFLQFLVTFGIGEKRERGFYRRLVVGVSWRRGMPRVAIKLGLEGMMSGMCWFCD